MSTLNTFIYEGKTYLKVIPAKYLFRSNMIHEVVTRGDIFAIDLETGELIIFNGSHKVIEKQMIIMPSAKTIVSEMKEEKPKRKIAVESSQRSFMFGTQEI